MDSQAKYCILARGDGAVYLRLPTKKGYEEKIWDHAAGCVLVEEAGGKVTDLRAYRRAEKDLQDSCEEVKPPTVTAVEAVTSLSGEAQEAEAKGGFKSRACFIATAAYGDPDAPEVEALRRFRDRRLLTNRAGTAFVRLYYRMSPPIARLIARRPKLRAAVRKTLDWVTRRAASL